MKILRNVSAYIVNHDGARLKALGSSLMYTDPLILEQLKPRVRLVGTLPCGQEIITSAVLSFILSNRTFRTSHGSNYSIESTRKCEKGALGLTATKVGVVLHKALCLDEASGVIFCDGPEEIKQYVRVIGPCIKRPVSKRDIRQRKHKRHEKKVTF